MAVNRMQALRVLLLFGTRPEAIKLAPVIKRLRLEPRCYKTMVAVTAQHREMLDQVMECLGITADFDLDLMRPGQSLARLSARAVLGCEKVLRQTRPDLVLVQGDTTTTLAAALAAFYQKIPVGHIEAGLRTFDLENPFPEEANRQLVSKLATWHFAATSQAGCNLRQEGIPAAHIFITGNPVVDAMRSVLDRQYDFSARGLGRIAKCKRLVMVTAHRRENFGTPLEEICRALFTLAENFPDVAFVFPVHRNPQVRRTVRKLLAQAKANLQLLPPLSYRDFINLLARAELVLTDSGGIQEEAPALGVPVFILRRVPERPEALAAGAQLLSLQSRAIVAAAAKRLASRVAGLRPGFCPFGDGRAADRIVQAIAWAYGRSRRPVAFNARRGK